MLKKRSFAFNPWSNNKHFLPMIQVVYASQQKIRENNFIISELYDQFDELDKDKEAIMAMGHDLAPHYLGQLKRYK